MSSSQLYPYRVKSPFRMLSVRMPWAALLVTGIKDVENRGYGTPWRGTLLIHVSRKPDQEAPESAWDQVPNGIPIRPSAVIGLVRLRDVVDDSTSEWATPGARHWLVDNAVALDVPVLASGFLGIRQPTPEVGAAVLANLGHQRQVVWE